MNEFDDEIVQDYLAECREHLSGIESDLMAMENDGAAVDLERVNRVFRAAHSIKGGAGFFNFTRIRDLAHKAENVLDLIRSQRMAASPQVVDALLQAFDKLRGMIDNPAVSEQTDIAECVRGLELVTVSGLPPEDKPSVSRTITISAGGKNARVSLSEFDFDSARRGGQKIYLIEYDLVHDVQRQGKNPLVLLKDLLRYGTVLASAFHLERAGTLEEETTNVLPLDILFASRVDTDLIGTVAAVPDEQIWKVDRDGMCHVVSQAVEAGHADQPAQPVPEEAPATGVAPGAGTESKTAREEVAPVSTAADSTVRLNVGVLDSLMNLAGELVLCRNQLGEAVTRGDAASIQAASQAISMVTSEVQQAVMRTRMQPVANLFQKFTRFVRDTARKLGKDVHLVIEANEVELDKTIVEGLSDPLSHMVRNAVDHGIELKAARENAGKPAAGTVFLRAWHEAGLVVIEVADDGRGLDPEKLASSAVAKGLLTPDAVAVMGEAEKMDLILLPGFSTAERVTDLSGRGVGMDVVKTNLDQLGGKLEIHSVKGRGTAFRIRLPLTLAIIPSLLISVGEERVAVPLVNVQNLIRVGDGSANRIERVGTSPVLVLRDTLVPLVDLRRVMDMEEAQATAAEARNVVLVSGGGHQYGLLAERLHDTIEIVVKPLGQRLQHLRQYAGATILGDGCVALILDVGGVAAAAGLARENCAAQSGDATVSAADDFHHLLLVQNSAEETCALPLHLVERVEKIAPEQVEFVGGRRSMQYRKRNLPLMTLADAAKVQELALGKDLVVVVFEMSGRNVGLLASLPVDVIETKLEIDGFTLRQPGVMGSAILRGRTTLILDPFELAEASVPGLEPEGKQEQAAAAAGIKILYAEDSAFFREHTGRVLSEAGYTVLAAADGQEAWEIVGRQGHEIQLVLTDVEMPRLDGLQLTQRIRGDRRVAHLPVVMLTSLAGEDDIKRGQEAGATAYCIKLDRDRVLGTIREALAAAGRGTGGGLAALSHHVNETAEAQFALSGSRS